ncbi:MAG: hypothetical protein ACRDMZ_13495, partial [Solirubrobacteraceae bacterium]
MARLVARQASDVGVLVILEMDGPSDALPAAAAGLEAGRSAPAVLARMIASTDSGIAWRRSESLPRRATT